MTMTNTTEEEAQMRAEACTIDQMEERLLKMNAWTYGYGDLQDKISNAVLAFGTRWGKTYLDVLFPRG